MFRPNVGSARETCLLPRGVCVRRQLRVKGQEIVVEGETSQCVGGGAGQRPGLMFSPSPAEERWLRWDQGTLKKVFTEQRA